MANRRTNKSTARKSVSKASAPKPTVAKKKKSKTNTSTKVLIILGIFALLFILTMIVTFWVKDSVPDTLIQYVLGAGGVEALLLAGIKISKVLTESKKEIAFKRYGNTSEPSPVGDIEEDNDDEEVVR